MTRGRWWLGIVSAALAASGLAQPQGDAAAVIQEYQDRLPAYARPGWTRPEHLQPDFLGPARERPGLAPGASLVRALPYPFANALTLTADVDMSTFATVGLFHDLVQREYALSFGQSFFLLSSGGHAQRPTVSLFSDGSELPMRRAAAASGIADRTDQAFLRLFYGGAFDYVHSYGEDGVPPYPLFDDLAAEAGADFHGEALVERTPEELRPPAGQGLYFSLAVRGEVDRVELSIVDPERREFRSVLPESWLVPGPDRLRHLCFDDFTRSEPAGPGRETWNPARDVLTSLRLRLWGSPESAVSLSGVRLTFLTRDVVERQLQVAERLNLAQAVSIRHGGYTGQTGRSYYLRGVRQLETRYTYVDAQHNLPAAQRWSADDPQTPFYHVDVMRTGFGTDFYDAANSFEPPPVQSLAVPAFGLDGEPYYSFDRLHDQAHLKGLRLQVEGAPVGSVHALGAQIEYALRRLREGAGRAAVLYTHYGSFQMPGMPARQTRELPCHEKTRSGLELLQARHYDIFGELPLRDRVWATSAPVLLRFAVARAAIESQSRVDYERSRVEVTSWRDPVLRRRIPSAAGVGELHGLTFYVKDSARAEVFLDGRPLTSFKRNPADDSGRQSISLVDDSRRQALLDEVDPELQGRIALRAARFSMAQGGLAQGRARGLLELDGAAARLELFPDLMDGYGASHFRFQYRKSARFHVQLGVEDARGVTTLAREAGSAPAPDQGWTIPDAGPGELRDVVLDFADMMPGSAGYKVVPRARLRKLFVTVEGAAPGERLELDRVEFLREDPRPLHALRDTVVLAGRVEAAPGALVHAQVDGEPRVVLTDEDGYYMLAPVPRGAEVRLWATRGGARVYPKAGRALAAFEDRADLDLR